jgi:hypothetical protein
MENTLIKLKDSASFVEEGDFDENMSVPGHVFWGQ